MSLYSPSVLNSIAPSSVVDWTAEEVQENFHLTFFVDENENEKYTNFYKTIQIF